MWLLNFIREHRQKIFVTLSRFWALRGWEGLSEFVKKEKFVEKIFFQIMLNEVLNEFEKQYLLM